jgi:hypothetical protein
VSLPSDCQDGPMHAVVGEVNMEEASEPRNGVGDGVEDVVVGEVEQHEEEHVQCAVEAVVAEVQHTDLAKVGERVKRAPQVQREEDDVVVVGGAADSCLVASACVADAPVGWLPGCRARQLGRGARRRMIGGTREKLLRAVGDGVLRVGAM